MGEEVTIDLSEPRFRVAYPLYSSLLLTAIVCLGLTCMYFMPLHRVFCGQHPEQPDWCFRAAGQAIASVTQTTVVATVVDSDLSADPKDWQVRWCERFEQASLGKYTSIELVWVPKTRIIQIKLITPFQATNRPASANQSINGYSRQVGTIVVPAHFGGDRPTNYTALWPIFRCLTNPEGWPTVSETSLATATQVVAEQHERVITNSSMTLLFSSNLLALCGVFALFAMGGCRQMAHAVRALSRFLEQAGVPHAQPPTFWQLIRQRNPFEAATDYAGSVVGACNAHMITIHRRKKERNQQERAAARLIPLQTEFTVRAEAANRLLAERQAAGTFPEECLAHVALANNESVSLEDRLVALRHVEYVLRQPIRQPQHELLMSRIGAIDTTQLSVAALGHFRDYVDRALKEARVNKRAYWLRKALEAAGEKP